MHQEQRDRARQALTARGIQRALFASQFSITWLTGFVPPLHVGISPVAGGPGLVWYEDGQCTLIVMEGWKELAQQSDCSLVTYPAQTIDEPLSGARRLAEALAGVLSGASGASGTLGVELDHLPVGLAQVVRDHLPGFTWMGIDHLLEPLRMVKTGEELDRMKLNFHLADIGQAAARAAVAPGMREVDVWSAAQSAIVRAAGQNIAMGNDCVSGRRQANIGGMPGDLALAQGDSIIVDISTILGGYWSDGCAAYYAGTPSARQAEIHTTVQQALDLGISLAKPGTPVQVIDREMRRLIESKGYPVYPHHSGHGVGVSGHEEPRIVPYNTQTLQTGMVIMLEPGIYFPGETGVRLEDALLITPTGAQVLTHHDKSLPG